MNEAAKVMTREEHEFDITDIKAYEAWLRSLAWQVLRNAHDVDDAVQEVWLANLGRKEASIPSRAWLGAVTRNISISKRRRIARRGDVERRAARREELDENVQSAIERVSLYRRLLSWVLEMDEPYRETLLLHYARDLGQQEIARLMNVPDSTVRVRLRRGLIILRKKARGEFDDDRRRQLVLLLFGSHATRTASRGAGILSAAMLGIVCIAVAFVISAERADDDMLRPVVGPDGFATDARRVARSTDDALTVAVSKGSRTDLAQQPEEHTLRGRLEFTVGGRLHPGRVLIEAVPFMVGPAMRLPAIRPRMPKTDVPGGLAAGLDTLFVTGGLSSGELGPDPEHPDPALLAPYLDARDLAPQYAIGRLR